MTQRKRRADWFHRYLANPITVRLPTQVVLETTGRRTGLPRRTPVGGRIISRQFWMSPATARRPTMCETSRSTMRFDYESKGVGVGGPQSYCLTTMPPCDSRSCRASTAPWCARWAPSRSPFASTSSRSDEDCLPPAEATQSTAQNPCGRRRSSNWAFGHAPTSSDGSDHSQFSERNTTISRTTSRVLAVKLLPELALSDTSRSKNATSTPWRTKGISDRQGPV